MGGVMAGLPEERAGARLCSHSWLVWCLCIMSDSSFLSLSLFPQFLSASSHLTPLILSLSHAVSLFPPFLSPFLSTYLLLALPSETIMRSWERHPELEIGLRVGAGKPEEPIFLPYGGSVAGGIARRASASRAHR